MIKGSIFLHEQNDMFDIGDGTRERSGCQAEAGDQQLHTHLESILCTTLKPASY
jgi:hypothetical protein